MHTPLQPHHPPILSTPVALTVAGVFALMLMGCGGDVSWCYHNQSGQVVAGYNTTQCLPDGAGKPNTASTSTTPAASQASSPLPTTP